ncbi:MAG: hypothetical protein HY775_03835 [Acidobacteria bacterium]|nr:hypothetical protein [Acidobacteriota bacterium]
MSRLPDDQYYVERAVEHAQQGDIYGDIPLSYSAPPVGLQDRAGKRRRPDRPAEAMTVVRTARWAVVCSYTCGFLAQPPGTRGYSHPYRLMAEITPLREIVGDQGITADQARGIARTGGAQGLMYVPLPEADPTADEWRGAGVILLSMPSLVAQPLLDASRRVARMSEGAQRILMGRLFQTVGPYMPEPHDPSLAPDISDGWASIKA